MRKKLFSAPKALVLPVFLHCSDCGIENRFPVNKAVVHKNQGDGKQGNTFITLDFCKLMRF